MRPLIRRYDALAGRLIGRLPKSWYGFLDKLCIFMGPLGWTFIVLAGITYAVYHANRSLIYLSLLTIILLPLAEFVKLIFRRPRPLSLYAQSMRLKSYSFPSGHAYGASLGCSYLAVFASEYVSGGLLALISVVLGVLALTVAIARVYLKAHFPSDVTVGLLMGVFVMSTVVWRFM